MVVDFQAKLLPAIHERERVVRKGGQLLRGAAALGLPIVATEQYPQGLGSTVQEIAEAIPNFKPIAKMSFSSCGAPGFVETIAARGGKRVLLCGIESHVCILQSCLDLLDRGVEVFVAEDAVSSRTVFDWRCGVERMRQAGATIVTVEMALLELLGGADRPEFKQVLGIVK